MASKELRDQVIREASQKANKGVVVKRCKPNRDAIERGLFFERRVADVLDGRLQPGSGNQFYAKNDVIAHGLSVSCKSEVKLSWSKINRHLSESIENSFQTGNIPVLAVEDADTTDELIVMKLSDFAKAFSFSDGVKIPDHSDSKGLAKRKTAEVPVMLR